MRNGQETTRRRKFEIDTKAEKLLFSAHFIYQHVRKVKLE
jgi:hypothetical protein